MRHQTLYFKFTTERKYRLIVPVLMAALILAGASVPISKTPVTYKSAARIWIQASNPFSSGDNTNPGAIPDSPLMENASSLTTFCEILQSDAVLDLAYEDLKQKLPPNKLPDKSALDGVRGTPTKDANIITVEYRNADPEVAKAVVESLITALVKENALQIAGPLEDERKRLEKQLELAKADYEKTKERLKNFMHDNSSVDFNAESGDLASKRAEVKSMLEEAQQDLTSCKKQVAFLQEQLGFGPDDVLSVEKVSSDPAVLSLKDSIAKTQVSLIEMRAKFQEEHPQVKRLKAILEKDQEEIAKRYSELIGKVNPKFDGFSATNDAQQSMLSQMIEGRTQILTDESKIKSMTDYIAELGQEVLEVPKKQKELADIQREDDLASSSLEAIESEMQRVKLTESVSLSSSRMQVIDNYQGTDNARHTMWMIAMAASLLGAAVVALLQYLIDPRVLTAGQTGALSSLFVGWVPRFKTGIEQVIPATDRLRSQIKLWLNRSKIVWITSANEADGKTLVAHALAESFVDSGAKVILVDANLEHPTLHVELNQSGSPGLVQYFQNEASLSSIVTEIRPNFSFIPAGGVGFNLRMLSGAQFAQVLSTLCQSFDIVLVDTPAAGYDESGLHMCDNHSNLLVVVRVGHTVKKSLQILHNQIQVLTLNGIGLVLNEVGGKAVTSIARELGQQSISASNDTQTTDKSDLSANNEVAAKW